MQELDQPRSRRPVNGRGVGSNAHSEAAVDSGALRSLIDHLPCLIWIADRETRSVRTMNRAAIKRLGFDASQVEVLRLTSLLEVSEIDRVGELWSQGTPSPQNGDANPLGVWKLQTNDGSACAAELWAGPIRFNQSDCVLFLAYEVTQREQERARSAAQLEAASRRLLEVQEAERRHIACELHDEIGQLLTGLKLQLEIGSRQSDRELRKTVGEALAQVKELTAQVRNLSLSLRPAMLDDLGLLPALLWHFERYTAATAVRVEFEHQGLGRRFPAELETAAYRIVQEALTNVARYAAVDLATVRVWSDPDGFLRLGIEDHGVGFDPKDSSKQGKSTGLSGMIERASLLGGQLTIDSYPGKGTRVHAALPVQCTTGRNYNGGDYVGSGG